jgi:cell division protease FtsH
MIPATSAGRWALRHLTGTARSGPPPDRPPSPAPPPPPAWRNWLLIGGLLVTVALSLLPVPTAGKVVQLVFGETSTGAANDLAGATDLATRMVREFGMSQTLGPVGFASGSPMYLGTEEVRSRPYAEATQRVVDEEVAKLLRQAEDRATRLLGDHRDALERLTELLLERETVDGTDVDEVLGRIPGQPQPIGATGHTATTIPAEGSTTTTRR